jgi:hypothetical protein
MKEMTALVLDTACCTSVALYPSRAIANRALYAYVLENWAESTDRALPADPEEAVGIYYNDIALDERYTIVDGVSLCESDEVERDVADGLATYQRGARTSCQRCGSALATNGHCWDVTCPYSDRQQHETFTEG